MKQCEDIVQVLRELDHGNDNICLKVIRNKKGDVAFKRTAGTITVKLENRRTYTMSVNTYEKIRPYLV